MTESEKFEQESGPSAFAIAIIIGGTAGITISHMMGISGNVGFLLGFSILFIVLVIAILRARSDQRDELIVGLENEILMVRKKIFDSFIEPPTGIVDSDLNELTEHKREQNELKDAISKLRKTGFISGGIRPFRRSVEIKAFTSELDFITETIKKLRKKDEYKTQVKALEILRQQAEAEIRFLAERGVGK